MAATLQRKSSGGNIFVIITKIITKEMVPRNYFVIISARMVFLVFLHRVFHPKILAELFCVILGKYPSLNYYQISDEVRSNYIKELSGNYVAQKIQDPFHQTILGELIA